MFDLEYVRAYIYDVLVLTKGSFEDHMDKLEQVLLRLQKAGLKVSGNKCSFVQDMVEYLGYVITREGIQPVNKRVEAINNIAPPKTRKEL